MNIRWRGSIISAVSLAAFLVLFYGFYMRGYDGVKPLLVLLVLVGMVGGALAIGDSFASISSSRKARNDKHDRS